LRLIAESWRVCFAYGYCFQFFFAIQLFLIIFIELIVLAGINTQKNKVSAVGVLDYGGVDQQFKALVALAKAAREVSVLPDISFD
jgi:hypothetical protein